MKINEDRCLEILHALIDPVKDLGGNPKVKLWAGKADPDLADTFNKNKFKHIKIDVTPTLRYRVYFKGIKIETLIDWFIKNLPKAENLLIGFEGHGGWDIRKSKDFVMESIKEHLKWDNDEFTIFQISNTKSNTPIYESGNIWYTKKTKAFQFTLDETDRANFLNKNNILFKLMHFAMNLD